MRRFLLVALILTLVVALAAVLAGTALLYTYQQQEQERTQDQLDDCATRTAALQHTLTRLFESERETATLQAESSSPPTPVPEQDGGHPTATPPARPAVTLTAPTAGDQFQEWEEVAIRWRASGQSGVEGITLQVDGHQVDEFAAGGALSIDGEFHWVATGLGTHRLIVTASNSSGLESHPASVAIHVVPDANTPRPTEQDEANFAIMDAIEPLVTELRGLELRRPVTRTLFTRDELRQQIVHELNQDLTADEARKDAIEMAAFDFIPADTDLRTLMETLYTEQIAGYYDSDAQSLAVASDEGLMGPLGKSTFAHEFAHALQDQHWGLDTLDPEENSDDASLAVMALIEGDALLLQQQYILEYLDTDELFELLSESLAADTEVLDTVPPIIRAHLMFPYEAGLEFIQTLYQTGAYEAVDSAFSDPPQSTEHILHPERFLAGEPPQIVSLPPLTETLGNDWVWIDENVLGEFTLTLYLEQQIGAGRGAAPAEGWGGDRYAVYANQETGAIVMVMRTTWDTRSEADEFADAFLGFGKARFGFAPEGTETAACWEAEDAICIYQIEAETLIIRAPDQDLITKLKTLFAGY
jgi:hypothetical protein